MYRNGLNFNSQLSRNLRTYAAQQAEEYKRTGLTEKQRDYADAMSRRFGLRLEKVEQWLKEGMPDISLPIEQNERCYFTWQFKSVRRTK